MLPAIKDMFLSIVGSDIDLESLESTERTWT